MFRAYKKEDEHSYALGAFPSLELIKCRPKDMCALLLHSKFNMPEDVANVITALDPAIPVVTDDRAVERIAKKGNTFMVGVFAKREYPLTEGNRLVLYMPSDAGNLGTIIRTAVGFGVKNIIIIGDAVDIFDPKTVRASMGAIFRINIKRYDSIEEYATGCRLPKYMFMLGADKVLSDIKPSALPAAFVFGNEASGLPLNAANYGVPVVIKHSPEIDSLALPQAVAIGLYHLTKIPY